MIARTGEALSPEHQQADLTARFFRGLGDPTRILTLRFRLDGEKNVTDLVGLAGSPQGRA
ncbi:MAG TPA: hypothetical protein VKT80_10815 [Chloroflexota bacterium]|nr:hypothetical protein [Chloroflexota bacterium]